MRGNAKILLGICLIFQLLSVESRAAEPVRLAYSEKLGVTIFAYPDDKNEWCRAKLGISFLIKDGSPLLSDGIDGMLSKFGALFAEKCPAATSASIAVYKAADRSLIGKPFVVAKADNWSRPSETAAAPPPEQAPAVDQPLPCDHGTVASDYFVSACVARGLEIRRQSDALEEARSKQADAAKTLRCTPQSMTRVNDLAIQASLRIVSSGAISPLMDFADGMRVECKKAAPDLLK